MLTTRAQLVPFVFSGSKQENLAFFCKLPMHCRHVAGLYCTETLRQGCDIRRHACRWGPVHAWKFRGEDVCAPEGRSLRQSGVEVVWQLAQMVPVPLAPFTGGDPRRCTGLPRLDLRARPMLPAVRLPNCYLPALYWWGRLAGVN